MFIRRIYIIVSFFGIASISNAQSSISELEMDSLINDLHNAINSQRSIEIEEIKGVYKLTPWHFAPSLNYDFINNNYYLTIATGPFVSHMIGKRQETRRISATTRKYDNQIKSAEIRLRSILISIKQRITDIELSHAIVTNDIEIYQIKFAENYNNEIDTETFLREKSAILNKIRSHNSNIADVQRQLLEVELLTETVIEIDLSHLIVSHVKILGINNE